MTRKIQFYFDSFYYRNMHTGTIVRHHRKYDAVFSEHYFSKENAYVTEVIKPHSDIIRKHDDENIDMHLSYNA